jgi:hypothetical protein
MMKRGLFLAVVVIGFLIAAWSPIGAASVPGGGLPQATDQPPGTTLQITVIAPTALVPGAPANPGTGLPSTVVIGLLVIIGIAVIVGGMALASRGRS